MGGAARTALLCAAASAARSGLSRGSQECRPGSRIQIPVDRFPAVLHVKFAPFPGAEADKSCASQMSSGFVNFIRCAGGIRLEDLVRFAAVESPDRASQSFRNRLSFAEHRPGRLLLRV